MSTCQSGGSKHVKARGSRAEVFHGTAKKNYRWSYQETLEEEQAWKNRFY